MGLIKIPFSLLSLPLILLLISGFFICVDGGDDGATVSDITKLVYRGCAAQKFPDPTGVFSQNVKALFASLLSQSAAGKGYFATTSGGDGGNAAKGLYQCRGDLSDDQCSKCVTKLPETAAKLCGVTAAVRVQLNGCYLWYEVAGFDEFAMDNFLYKVCGSGKAPIRDGFEERRDEALEMVGNGLKNGSSGGGGGSDDGLFYTGSYRDVYALAQCEGGLAAGDCRSCVKSAVDNAKARCGSSISAQIYLSRCYISYSYYPNGVPSISSASSSGSGNKHTQRTVAIVLGGLAALGFLIACLMFARSVMKKKRSSSSSNKHGGEWY